MRKFFDYGCVALAALALNTAVAFAHDPNPAKIPKKFMKFETLKAAIFKKMEQSGANRGVFSLSTLWSPRYTTLKVCFMDGSKSIRQYVDTQASNWNAAQSSLKLDFGKFSKPRSCDPNTLSDIRVTFTGDGSSSLVGVESRTLYPDEASLSLGGFENVSADELDDAENKATVMHEFGHALGLLHEHQSEALNCDLQFDWDRIYSTLESAPNNWSQAQVDHNMRTLRGEDYRTTTYDRESIMLYSFPADFFKAGSFSPCYKLPNHSITSQDFQLIEAMYPVDLKERSTRYLFQRTAFQSALRAAIPLSTDRSALPKFDLMKIYYPNEK